MAITLLVLLYIFFPFVIIYLCKKYRFFNKLGSIVLAYGFGLVLGTSGILPSGSDAYHLALEGRVALPEDELNKLLSAGTITQQDAYVNSIATVQDLLTSIVVPLAFPLLLFSLNIRRWLRFAKEGFISMFLALISVIIIIFTGFLIFKSMVPENWKVAGMLIGVYTGGTPNLVSLKVALSVDPSLFLMTSTYDMLLGAVTFIFMITAGPKIFRAILPPFKAHAEADSNIHVDLNSQDFDDFTGMSQKKVVFPLLAAVGIAIVIFAISYVTSLLLPSLPQMVVVILSITTLSILASLIPRINGIEKTFQLGMYFILVFSFAVASMADLKTIFSITFLGLMGFVTYAYFGSLLLHLLLSKIFRINADDYLITTTAFVFSPPFVPVVASALKNKDLIITGITVGIIGYVIGNYLGVAMGYFLKAF